MGERRSTWRDAAIVAAVSVPATAAIGYAFGWIGANGFPGTEEWPPAWWPFACAARSGGGLLATTCGLLPYGAIVGYRCGWIAILVAPAAVLVLAGLLIPAVSAGSRQFVGSNLFALVVIWAAGAALILAAATALGAAYGDLLRRRASRSATE